MATRTAEREAAFFLPHLRPGMRLLDVGCGPGGVTVGFPQAIALGEVVGVDVEPAMVALARALAVERGITNARFESADAARLPFPDDSFDAVFENTVLDHVADPLAVVREMRRVLRPGGVSRPSPPTPLPSLGEGSMGVRLGTRLGGGAT